MTSPRFPPTVAEVIVQAEFEAMQVRCEASGVSRDESRRILSNSFFTASLNRMAESFREEEAAKAASPAGQALQKAWDLDLAFRRANQPYARNDTPEFLAICNEYLRLVHDVGPGDDVEIHAWVKPRTIHLKKFRLCFNSAESADEAFMWFEGDPIRNCPSKEPGVSYGGDLSSRVYKGLDRGVRAVRAGAR